MIMPNVPKRNKRPWLTGERTHSKERLIRNKFYQTTRWRKLRAMFIKEFPLCVECGNVGQVVDHILPIKDGGHALDWENLQTMCHRCHNVKSAKEGRR
jgi:5-methylcytosine-specific restriction protein A